MQQVVTHQQTSRLVDHHKWSIHLTINEQHTMHKRQTQRPRSPDAAEQGTQPSRNSTTTLIATTPGKSTKLPFHDFCISNFTHYDVSNYARDIKIESRIGNHSPRNHRKKPSLIILNQSRPPKISAHNTSHATLQTQIPYRVKPQSYSRNQKIPYKHTKTQIRSDKHYTTHSIQPTHINPRTANTIPYRVKKPQSYPNHVPTIPCISEPCQKPGKTKA
jgi:hypothetical protein